MKNLKQMKGYVSGGLEPDDVIRDLEDEPRAMNLKQIEEKIGIAIGEASMCWSETPKGVFDSTNAKRVADNLSKDIMKKITQLIEELKEEDIDEKITDINYADGYNQRNQILNSKINKILNK